MLPFSTARAAERAAALCRVHNATQRNATQEDTHGAVRPLACCKRMLMYVKQMQEKGWR